MPDSPNIIFIASLSRSGSTLMDRLLGQEAGFFSMGEIRHIWRRSVIENQLCGCGRIFSDCSFWDSVIRDSFGRLSKKDATHIDRIFRKIHRVACLPQICWSDLHSKPYRQLLETWGKIVNALFHSISKISGAEYLIDSSKTPTYGLLLSQVLKKEKLFVVHLLRDPRAVSFSRIRRKKRPEIHWEKKYMGITPPYKTAMQWVICNLLCEMLARKVPSLQIRYEDMVNYPEPILSNMIKKITDQKNTISSIHCNRAILDPGHTSSGNPMRFKVGEIEIVPDMEWKSKLPRKDQLKVSWISLPLLLKYAYLTVS